MNLADLVIIGILFIFILESFKRSFFDELGGLFSFIASFIIAIKYNHFAAKFLLNYFHVTHSLSLALGFLIVWTLAETIIVLILKLMFSRIKLPVSFSILNYFSIIPAFLKGLILISIFLVLLDSFPISPTVKRQINNSILAQEIIRSTTFLEKPLQGVFGDLSKDSIAFLTVKPQTNEIVNLGFSVSDLSSNNALEAEMIELVNKERTNRGINTLVFDSNLTQVARSHSSDMFKRGYFSHYSPEGEDVSDRAQKMNADFFVIGENLAFAPTLSVAHKGLMDSEGHRANILSVDFARIGIGIMENPDYGLMVTQVFSN